MSNLSVCEFKNLCDSLSPNRFIFSSDNQDWDRVESSLKMQLTFRIMMIAFNPNAICFKGSDGNIRLERVKRIRLNGEKSMLGTVFTVVCGDFSDDLHDVLYTVIAQ